MNFIAHTHPPEQLSSPALWFIFKADEILLQNERQIPALQSFDHSNLSPQYLGTFADVHCFAVEMQDQPGLAEDLQFYPVRQAHTLLQDEALFQVVIRAKQVLHWDKITQFCGSCGHKNQMHLKERAKQCTHCEAITYPQIAPVMLVLIWRENEILLARSAHFLPGVYSILAGFTEPGETLEGTVEREVLEEVGIKIKNLKYFGSQPWPFPSNLMLGFIAEYDSGELVVDKNELEDAAWFPIDQLPTLPRSISLSRKIIDAYVAEKMLGINQSPRTT